MQIRDVSPQELDAAMQKAWNSFHTYRNTSLLQRANLLRAIADEMNSIADGVVEIASRETNLPVPRLKNEFARTLFQLRSYASATEEGSWLEVRIDTADSERTPPKPDIRKMLVPLGPVIVFGASNFPFAYSTAGGDTACALAAGCPVIVKAHPAHPETSDKVAAAITKAVEKSGFDSGVFTHLHGAAKEVSQALVRHRYTKAVGFTGSYVAGKSLFDLANQRPDPIPVFAEMGSINPVFLFPHKLEDAAEQVADMYAASITQSVGQFCTNPGLIIGIESPALNRFIEKLTAAIQQVQAAPMLNKGIAEHYHANLDKARSQSGVTVLSEPAKTIGDAIYGEPVIASASGEAYLKNPVLHEEVFGPYSLVIRCSNIEQMIEVARNTQGQLTASLIATEQDIQENNQALQVIQNIAGRLVMNGVPTGVEVCLAMHHGGPFPATTDSRFTSVGADGIKRFARPVSFQNWPDELLPAELKASNPLGIWRTVNNQLTR